MSSHMHAHTDTHTHTLTQTCTHASCDVMRTVIKSQANGVCISDAKLNIFRISHWLMFLAVLGMDSDINLTNNITCISAIIQNQRLLCECSISILLQETFFSCSALHWDENILAKHKLAIYVYISQNYIDLQYF